MTDIHKKSGFVTLVGRSNVGKSTLLNSIIGTKLAIVTPKPQTTRHPVRGILHDERGQIVFVDTPGMFLGKRDYVSMRLNELAREQLDGIDVAAYIVDPTREPGQEEEHIQTILKTLSTPKVLVINKIDLPTTDRPWTDGFTSVDIGQTATYSVSAKMETGLQDLVDSLFNLLPIGPAYYPEQQYTDMAHEKWLAELIREKVFLRLEQEVPYSIYVEVTEDEEQPNDMQRIEATVWTTDERYKRMVIGARGQMIKQIGMDTRKELELVMNKKVYLALEVKVDPKWPQRFR